MLTCITTNFNTDLRRENGLYAIHNVSVIESTGEGLPWFIYFIINDLYLNPVMCQASKSSKVPEEKLGSNSKVEISVRKGCTQGDNKTKCGSSHNSY